MISLSWSGNPNAQIAALMSRYAELPRHIAKKHLQAAMKRCMKDGVPVLRSITPKGKTRTIKSTIRRGEFKNDFKQRGGALRRAATTKAKYIGRNKDGVVYGTIGYKAGFESRKALWLEFGTSRGIQPRKIMEQFRRQYGGPAAAKLAKEMRSALEASARELASGKNPTRSYG